MTEYWTVENWLRLVTPRIFTVASNGSNSLWFHPQYTAIQL